MPTTGQRSLTGQTLGWVLDSALDRTTGEEQIARYVFVGGDTVGPVQAEMAILGVTCENHNLSVWLTSVSGRMFKDHVGNTVDLATRRNDGSWVAEHWPLTDPTWAEVTGAPAVALALDLAADTTFAVSEEGVVPESFHIPNTDVLAGLLSRCGG